jgi:putative transposase
LQNGRAVKDPLWTESIAVGSKGFIEEIKEKMEAKAKGRQVHGRDENYIHREPENSYPTHFDHERYHLRPENTLFLDAYDGNSER